MKAWLASFGVTHEEVLNAIDSAVTPRFYPGDMARIYSCGLCGVFGSCRAQICDVLRALGGHSREGLFWGIPGPRNKRAAEQRLMMLAFLLEWTK